MTVAGFVFAAGQARCNTLKPSSRCAAMGVARIRLAAASSRTPQGKLGTLLSRLPSSGSSAGNMLRAEPAEYVRQAPKGGHRLHRCRQRQCTFGDAVPLRLLRRWYGRSRSCANTSALLICLQGALRTSSSGSFCAISCSVASDCLGLFSRERVHSLQALVSVWVRKSITSFKPSTQHRSCITPARCGRHHTDGAPAVCLQPQKYSVRVDLRGIGHG